jgi:hypothetical protein
MKIEVIPGHTHLVAPARDMHQGKIGKVRDTVDELYLVRQIIGFIKIWPNSNCFEFAATVPDTWAVEILPVGTVLKLTF